MIVPPLSRDQVRNVDKVAIEQYGIPGIVLMENAGRGAAEIIDRIAPRGPIVILCGTGNNGGDGYVIAGTWNWLAVRLGSFRLSN